MASTPLGDFVRARRDATAPESVGLPAGPRRRVPGLRRSELAGLAGISVEYLIRIEQGSDRNPSASVLEALAGALALDATERDRLRHLAAIGGDCAGPARPGSRPERPRRPAALRRTVLGLLEQLEPSPAIVTDRLGEVLARTQGFELMAGPSGLLDTERPNVTRYVFTDPRAREVLPDWERIADERAADLWLVRSGEQAVAFVEELTPRAGAAFTDRLHRHPPPLGGPIRWRHPAGDLLLDRELLELPAADAQQLTVFLAADTATATTLKSLHVAASPLRVAS